MCDTDGIQHLGFFSMIDLSAFEKAIAQTDEAL